MKHLEHQITKYQANEQLQQKADYLVIEEPLQISISLVEQGIIEKNISVTMRTPRQDIELALGFLFTEDIITDFSEIDRVKQFYNRVDVVLKEKNTVDFDKLQRHFYTTSSCGVCGKSSVEAIKSKRLTRPQPKGKDFMISAKLLLALPEKLRIHQTLFDMTGGLHAAAIFDTSGNLIKVFEDVGRHNALDKLVGWGLQNEQLPFTNVVLLLSGRSSFELLQKSILAGIHCVASVGAPSSLALKLAKEFDITLIGFLKKKTFNVYNCSERIIFD